MVKIGPGWKLWMTAMMTMVLTLVISVTISVRVAEHSTRIALAQEEKNRTIRHTALCQVVGNILSAYQETPPATPAGTNVAQAWLDEYRTLGCLPSK